MKRTSAVYLSKLRLNPLSREVQRDLGSVKEMHRSVMRGFGPVDVGPAREHHGVLYRLELDMAAGRAQVLVQSLSEPDWQRLPEGYLLCDGESGAVLKNIAPMLAGVEKGQQLRFRLVANPTKRVSLGRPPTGGDDKTPKRSGPRVELRGEEARRAWLLRRATMAGFHIEERDEMEDVRQVEHPKRYGGHGKRRRHSVVVAPVAFEGRLVVDAPDLLRQAVVSGIGPGKAYGMGLLSLARGR